MGKCKGRNKQVRQVIQHLRNTLALVTDKPSKRKQKRQKRKSPSLEAKFKAFYCSKEWATARYKALKSSDGCCKCCGRSAADGVKLVVDHKKPIRYFWALRLDQENLQVLCNLCNRGKGSWDYTDWSALETYHGIPFYH